MAGRSSEVHLASLTVIPAKVGPSAATGTDETTVCLYSGKQTERNLYTGVTSDIVRRTWEHRTGQIEGFTKHYGVHRLVFAEFHESMADAIVRAKRMKKWRRAWKLELIEADNPSWRDLYDEYVP
jgi:putative endonuclease